MKKKIHELPLEIDFKLYAIASHLNHYKISWLFNEELQMKFQQVEDLIITDYKNKQESKFSVFLYEDNHNSFFTLYSNHSGNNFLLKSIRNIDYILKYQGYLTDGLLHPQLDKMKKLPNILTVSKIEPDLLKQNELEKFF